MKIEKEEIQRLLTCVKEAYFEGFEAGDEPFFEDATECNSYLHYRKTAAETGWLRSQAKKEKETFRCRYL